MGHISQAAPCIHLDATAFVCHIPVCILGCHVRHEVIGCCGYRVSSPPPLLGNHHPTSSRVYLTQPSHKGKIPTSSSTMFYLCARATPPPPPCARHNSLVAAYTRPGMQSLSPLFSTKTMRTTRFSHPSLPAATASTVDRAENNIASLWQLQPTRRTSKIEIQPRSNLQPETVLMSAVTTTNSKSIIHLLTAKSVGIIRSQFHSRDRP